MSTIDRRTLLIATGALACVGSAHGHGEPKHPNTGAPVAKEQQPWGIAGEARRATRTVDLRMLDSMRFVPDRLAVKLGQTLRLRIRNTGAVLHELVIGTPAALDEHAALMLRFPDMQHDEPWMAHVPPGKTGEIVWTFNRAGEFAFACLIAGHYQAGMAGRISVRAA
ncbi:cupredoxin family protein [Rhizobacter sp. AJA081-3]|uniref:cupredoxin domain-containing protein n=1 Tax=Rhizobacter sp. AJA081-3 TaxID=2753607 RepID=UPI001AE07C36|nr:cupredoxin family protein [Rhizobacter sp. AJA081-3]QTN24102.1 cupredoxin family protein [Rhizobacter sp. AJA081-3]